MRRRKNRERRHIWLQRELDACGLVLNGPPIRKVPYPPSTTTPFEVIAAAAPVPAKRRRPRVVETTLFN